MHMLDQVSPSGHLTHNAIALLPFQNKAKRIPELDRRQWQR